MFQDTFKIQSLYSQIIIDHSDTLNNIWDIFSVQVDENAPQMLHCHVIMEADSHLLRWKLICQRF